MGIETARGIVLSKVVFSDTSLIITALTPNQGLLKLIGKGFRKPPKKASSSREPIESFSEMEFTYYRSSGEMHHLRESSIINPYWGIRSGYPSLLAACFAAGLANDLSGENEDEYFALCELFGSLDAKDPCLKVLRYWLKMVSCGGYLAGFTGCSRCGRNMDGESVPYFSGKGFLCTKCRNNQGDPQMVLTKGDLRYAEHLLEQRGLERVKLGFKVRQTLMSFLATITLHELGRPPRLLDRFRKICDNNKPINPH